MCLQSFKQAGCDTIVPNLNRMKKDIATIGTHGVVVLAIMLVEVILRGVLHYATEWGFVDKPASDYVAEIMSLFFVFAIVVFSVTAGVILVRNAYTSILDAWRNKHGN
jgi:hypothetical protein